MARFCALSCYLFFLASRFAAGGFFKCPNAEPCLMNSPLDVCQGTRDGAEKVKLAEATQFSDQWRPGTIDQGVYWDCDCEEGDDAMTHRTNVIHEIIFIQLDPHFPGDPAELQEYFGRINNSYTPDSVVNYHVLGVYSPRYILGEYFLLGKLAFNGGRAEFIDQVVGDIGPAIGDPNLWENSVDTTSHHLLPGTPVDTSTPITLASTYDFGDDCSVQVRSHIVTTPDEDVDAMRANIYEEDLPYATPEANVQLLCQLHEYLCRADFPQYESFTDCVQFLTGFPDVCDDTDYSRGDTNSCRLIHLILMNLDPFNHCQHIGKRSIPCAPEACGNYDARSDHAGCTGQRGYMRVTQEPPLASVLVNNWFLCCNECGDRPNCNGFNYNSDTRVCQMIRDDVVPQQQCVGGQSSWVTGPRRTGGAQALIAPPGPCSGACDAKGADGCWCDSECPKYGDCCDDACDTCGYECNKLNDPDYQYPEREENGNRIRSVAVLASAVAASVAIVGVIIFRKRKNRGSYGEV